MNINKTINELKDGIIEERQKRKVTIKKGEDE